MPHSTKPRKPSKDFPLFPHATRRWAKKVRGKTHYFGPWDDPDAALAKWLDQKDDLVAGRIPQTARRGQLTVKELVNEFLNSRRLRVESGELSNRTFLDYKAVGEKLADVLGRGRAVEYLTPGDFEKLRAVVAKGERGKGVGPVAIQNFVTRARSIFKFAYTRRLIDRPADFGDGFDRPRRHVFRKARNERELRMFTAEELRRIIAVAPQPLRAMILLGVNAGLGNSDVGQMRTEHIDLESGVLVYARPKTHVRRKAYLWPETVAAVQDWLERRPTPKNETDADLVFLTRCGASWHKTDAPDNPVSKEMAKLLKALGIERKGLSFYGLRRVLETIGSQTRDQPAVDRIMGHAERADDMAAIYREEAGDNTMDDRLRAVANHVHRWLFGR